MLPNGKIDFSKLHKKEEEIDVDIYFSKKELDEMSSYDKKRYKNLKMNYEVMLMMGMYTFTAGMSLCTIGVFCDQSLSVVRPSVNFFFKQHLLNHWSKFHITTECSL